MFITAALFMCAAVWFAMSASNYDARTTRFPFRTSGWFILGLPFFTIPLSLGYSALFCFLSRRKGRKIAWVTMLGVSAAILVSSVYSALPSTRIRAILGRDVAAETTLEALRCQDSFNDGIAWFGKLLASPKTVEKLVRRLSLARQSPSSLSPLLSCFEDEALPRYATAYSGEDWLLYFDPDTQRLYFYHRE